MAEVVRWREADGYFQAAVGRRMGGEAGTVSVGYGLHDRQAKAVTVAVAADDIQPLERLSPLSATPKPGTSTPSSLSRPGQQESPQPSSPAP
jgi:hypothetical protein